MKKKEKQRLKLQRKASAMKCGVCGSAMRASKVKNQWYFICQKDQWHPKVEKQKGHGGVNKDAMHHRLPGHYGLNQ